MPRLIIRNYHRDTTEADIRGLFGKIGDVEDVYMPEPTVTGIVRSFAIVNVSCSDESVQKYLKALNGSNWNSSRVNIEVAKEFYKDRLHNEKVAQKQQEEAEQVSIAASIEYAEWKAPFISLRVKSNAPCLKVSTIPGSYEKGIVPCGWKGFDARPMRSKKETLPSVPAAVTAAVSVPSSSSASAAKAESKVPPASNKPKDGGGLRKGFGTIVLPTAKPTPTTSAAATATTTTAPGDIGASVHCCIEEHDNTDELDGIDCRYLEEEYSEPCISEAELTEEVLQRERARAMKVVMDLLLMSGEAPSEQTTAGGAAGLTSPTGGAAAKPQQQQKAGDGWSGAVIKRFDPLKMAAANNTSNNQADHTPNDANIPVAAGSVGQSHFAEMNVLKDIFYKEGGVGWNESHTDVVQRSTGISNADGHTAGGSAADDALFLEAEKFGIDVRSSGSEVNNKMSFNFFGEDESIAALGSSREAKVTVATTAAVQHKDTIESDAEDENDTAAVAGLSGLSLLGKRKELLPPLSMEEVREMGNKFCRVASVDVIKKQWEEQREKLAEDYKKKSRESKKKGISKVTSAAAAAAGSASGVGSSASASRSSNSGSAGFKRGSSGGKGRGGVKHSKKNKK